MITTIVNQAMLDIQSSLTLLEEHEIQKAVSMISSARRLFIGGAGRSGLMMKAFAMRLMQAGLNVDIVGSELATAIDSRDVLILASISGETETSALFAKKARAMDTDVILITSVPDSVIARQANHIIHIPKTRTIFGKKNVLALGSILELCLLLVTDVIVEVFCTQRNIQQVDLLKRHANLE